MAHLVKALRDNIVPSWPILQGLVAVSALSGIIYLIALNFSSRKKLPPGPTGLPILGNLLQTLKARQKGPAGFGFYLGDLNRFGEMATLRMGAKNWVMLNSDRVIKEIIVNRNKITNERSFQPIASGVVSRWKRTLLRPVPDWVEGRKAMHHLLNGTSVKTYGTWQEQESALLLGAYLDDPSKWYAHHYRYTVAIAFRVVLGATLDRSTADLEDFRRMTTEFVIAIGGSAYDYFPILTKLPRWMQVGRKFWEDMGEWHYQVLRKWWVPFMESVNNNSAPSSWTRDFLVNQSPPYMGGVEDEAMYLALSIVSAGSDNTRMVLNTWVMSAIAYPETFLRTREAVEKVVGKSPTRLPDLADLKDASYVCAVIKELLRWRPPVPVVPPHLLTEDLEFEGFYFPAGTEMVINPYGVGRRGLKDGEDFVPERWMNSKETNILDGIWDMGGGRRVCVGYVITQQELFLAIARISLCFDITPTGPFDMYELRHDVRSEPFPVKMTVRSKLHEDLIRNEKKQVVDEIGTGW
ncbi:hypothetical protein QM012_006373 [Aureobasidium pullulans]|uniref:Cytochrome P450 n=1 Tax=Aureobasidium pullulans TaxID=5580 RepID=A0ABR0TND6_AURPU